MDALSTLVDAIAVMGCGGLMLIAIIRIFNGVAAHIRKPKPENASAEQMTEYHANAIRKVLMNVKDAPDD